jgi:hypothetical protein
MKFINKFFITIFAISISSAVLAFCLDQTIMKADYVAQQADKSGIYSDLARELPKQIAQGDPILESALSRTITPEFLKTNIAKYLANLESAYRSGASIPSLDLTSLIPQVQALGVKLTAQQQANLAKQLSIQPPQGQTAESSSPWVSTFYKRTTQSKWLLFLVSLAAATAVFATAPHNRFRAVGRGFIWGAVWLAGYWLIAKVVPSAAVHQLQKSLATPLAESVNKLVVLASAGVAQRLLIGAIALLGAAVIMFILGFFFHGSNQDGHSSPRRIPIPSLRGKD